MTTQSPIEAGGTEHLCPTAPIFAVGREQALAALRNAQVVACDETGARIEGCNAYQWVFCSSQAVVHTAEFTRAAQVVRDTMDGHQPEVWISDRYSAQQGHGRLHQTCLAHLDRKVRFVAEHGSDLTGMRLQLRFDRAFSLARNIADLAVSTVKNHKRALKRDLNAILASATDCPLARDLLGRSRRARDQILTSATAPEGRCHQQRQRTSAQAQRHPAQGDQWLSRQMGCRC